MRQEKEKIVCYSELAYAIGIVMLALGTALMERANLGISMVVAPAYLLHLRLSRVLPFFSFGMAEYAVQAVLLILLCLVVRRTRLSYLVSFGTAVFYGFALDLCTRAVGLLPGREMAGRILFYSLGMLLCAAGIAFLFRTYISPKVYELFVKEVSNRFGWPLARVKTVYDCCSCVLGIALSFLFFGFGCFEGVKAGTVVCALVNGWLIENFGRIADRIFRFQDALPWRKWFEKRRDGSR